MIAPQMPTAAGSLRQPRSKLIVVLPAYNEEANVGNLLDRIDQALTDADQPYEVIVVNDGSRDRTAEILARYEKLVPLTVFEHEINQGLGATIRDGLALAAKRARDSDMIITMDADETHTPGLMFRMVGAVHEGHDVVIASRYRTGARIYGLSLSRRFVSWAASWLFRIVFPIPGVRDYTCGYRVYRGSALRLAFERYGNSLVTGEGFNCMVDILLKMRGLPLVFGEVPMILRYDLKIGESKMQMAKTMRQTLMLMVERRLSMSDRGSTRSARAAANTLKGV
jgi:dolichol-phosphate mannosyltransferase